MYRVDLNSDLGESFGAYTLGLDREVLRQVSSANVACGFHAGDPVVMGRTVALVKAAGVDLGAHPGFPDLMGFGRRAMNASPAEVGAYVTYQLGALAAFARAADVPLRHVKPHGALYNLAAKDEALAAVIARAVAAVDPELILLGLAGSKLLSAGRAAGLRVASEVFADRTYQADGSLTPRSQPGAMLRDPDLAIARTVDMVTQGTVKAVTGETVAIRADSICVHGDNPEAVAFVERIRAALEAQGVEIAPLREVV